MLDGYGQSGLVFLFIQPIHSSTNSNSTSTWSCIYYLNEIYLLLLVVVPHNKSNQFLQAEHDM
jgi:hypothetical protein